MKRSTLFLLLSWLALGVFCQGGLQAAEANEVTLVGRAQCVDQSRKAVSCSEEHRDFGFVTDDGERYFFSSQDPRSQIFQDTRVRDQRLRVEGWLGEDRVVQITKVYSIKNGQLYEIYYYCPICAIRAYAGGPCWCCQEEFEFHETPVDP